ncbi:MAG TPA: phosphate ABC transporter substrate-binding protein PstS [Spirochaetia bacterium]|nr:phosphate ABC transporter substrate-binding protein PstS [Spirochaetia bacterium]
MKNRALPIAMIGVLMLIGTVAAFAGGQKENSSPASMAAAAGSKGATSNVTLSGAGSSFAYPIYSKMGSEYNKITDVQLNYQAIGSSGGIKDISNKVVDFGGSDAFLTDEQIAKMSAPIIQFPTVAGSIVITYNLPGNPTIRLTGDVIAKIFLGQITKWNDPAITSLNPGITLPSEDIIVAHRSDGSGTTFNFSLYLSRVNADWKSKVGYGTSVNWPAGLGGAQNAGVAGIITQTPGAIGYVELAYATENKLPFATLQNAAGNWIVASLASTSQAANTKIPADGRIYLDNTTAAQGYPITTLTWVIAYKEQSYAGRSEAQAKALVDFFWWMIHDGEKYAEGLQYSPLPAAAVTADENILRQITFNGKPILTK